MKRYDNGTIYDLEPNEKIVIGTNVKGIHGGGAAAYAAKHFGLEYGTGEGLSGQCYALPTMEGFEALQQAAKRFIAHANNDSDTTYYMTRVGCGIAGYRDDQVAPLFRDVPGNVMLPSEWLSYPKAVPEEVDKQMKEFGFELEKNPPEGYKVYSNGILRITDRQATFFVEAIASTRQATIKEVVKRVSREVIGGDEKHTRPSRGNKECAYFNHLYDDECDCGLTELNELRAKQRTALKKIDEEKS